MPNQHEQQELRIFGEFARVCPLEIELDSIEKRNPPEPDIFCRTLQGAHAFELVELIDRDRVARPIGDQLELMDALRDAARALPVNQREALADVWAEIKIRPDLSLRRRRVIAENLVGVLANKDRDFVGNVTLQDGNVEVAAARVTRLDIVGPHFYVPTGGAYEPVPLDAIAVKFAKEYCSEAPLHLLAYYDRQHAPLEQQVRQLRHFVEANLGKSVFKCVWIFNTYDGRICYPD